MVIGHGLVAKKFLSKYNTENNIIIFASGVSNSKCVDKNEFKREYDLVEYTLKTNSNKCFIYFSTCSMYDAEETNSAYVLHKKSIEDLIAKTSNSFYIFRVSNLVGESGNANTILNYLFANIQNGVSFNLWTNASRNLIDIDDMYSIIDEIITMGSYKNSVINIANTENYKVKNIIKEIETFTNKKAIYTELDKGHTYFIDTGLIMPILKKLHIHFSSIYLPGLLKKYYSNK